MLEMFYEQLNFELLEETEAYGVASLLGDFGGQLGLWMVPSSLHQPSLTSVTS